MKGRNTVIDIMKGIGIILMVVGHAGCPTFLYKFIYTFHMPLFFMISGWLISGNKPNLIKRLKALYWPFLFWGLISLIMQYPLYKLGIYSESYNQHEFLIHLLKIVSFAQSEPITRPLWFLKSLFFSFMFVSFIVWKITKSRRMYFITGSICFLLLYVGYILYKKCGLISYDIQREMMLPWLLWLGYFLKTKCILFSRIYISIFFILLLAILGQYVSINLISSQIGNPIILTLCSLLGFIIVYNIANRIEKLNYKFTAMLVFIGRNTMPILILHLICIKLLQKVMNTYNIDVVIGEISITPTPFWLLYSIVGIVLPLLLNQLYTNIKK